MGQLWCHTNMKNTLVLILSLLFSGLAAAQANPLDAFPAAKEGQQRFVIAVPKSEDDDALKVELIFGKTVPTDGVNHHFIAGSAKEVELQGWGYSYIEVDKVGAMASTLMRPPPGNKMVDTFVRINHALPLQRYNSRMPIVIYAPAGVEVRYRIWKATEEVKATQG